jgi:hypothetical protein
MGQVPVKVKGSVKIGDYILPSGEGDGLAIAVAPANMKASDYQRIIGVAWSESDGKEELFNLVNTAIGINQNDLARMVEQMQSVMNDMQLAIKAINPDYQVKLFEVEGPYTLSASGISVSPTHPDVAGAYFNKTYASREEALQSVKTALQEKANIDMSKNPMIERILDDPAFAKKALDHYTKVLTELQAQAASYKKG